MVNLPEKFTERMKRQLGEEFELFLSCYETEEYAGLRVNTEKISVENFLAITPFELTPVPWTENGFYYRKEDDVTRHPHYFAGLYYIQEPSAMLPASRLPIEPGCAVLDLCAAPGGKATELSSRLHGTGILVANDVSASRAKALYKNLSVWGSRNCCITGETPQKLLQTFGCYFDRILVDAPCSGEGMFRKDHSLVADWELRGPLYYAQLQKEILDCAVQMLRPGGMLVYSTCTFSKEEDEDVITWIMEKYPELILEQPLWADGFVHGEAPCEKTVRIWPHKIKGEGHFLALLRKCENVETSNKKATKENTAEPQENILKKGAKAELQKSQLKMPEEVRSFLDCLPEHLWRDCLYQQIKEQCLLLPSCQIPKKLRYLLTGLAAGTLKNGRFEPSQQLALVLKSSDFERVLNLESEDPRVLRYLKGETIDLEEAEEAQILATQKKKKKTDAANGWVLICVDGYGLGWGKYGNGRIKNKYYPGWRLQ